jgi:hypothetical protein
MKEFGYKILIDARLYGLEKLVNQHLEKGWTLVGGVAVTNTEYVQAVFKEDTSTGEDDARPESQRRSQENR